MEKKIALAGSSDPTPDDQWTLTIDLTRNAVEIRNDRRGAFFVRTHAANGSPRAVGRYDRAAFVDALATAATLHPDLGVDFGLASRRVVHRHPPDSLRA